MKLGRVTFWQWVAVTKAQEVVQVTCTAVWQDNSQEVSTLRDHWIAARSTS